MGSHPQAEDRTLPSAQFFWLVGEALCIKSAPSAIMAAAAPSTRVLAECVTFILTRTWPNRPLTGWRGGVR